MKNRLIPVLAAGAGVVALLIGGNSAFAAGGADLAQKNGCMACHSIDKKVLGPAYKDVAKKYKGNADAVAMLSKKIKDGSTGVWGAIPMPPNGPRVSDADIKVLAEWVLASN
ncbi:c-type cytochrome [Herminiimonas sp. CN]|uniref:c-type cytochrome n=1 Tax=Herminiimonas sp. CN TaxID=1349818 RepID=UPI000686DE0E|nr:c-type cytochrome [Herminiimonas sp. CN]